MRLLRGKMHAAGAQGDTGPIEEALASMATLRASLDGRETQPVSAPVSFSLSVEMLEWLRDESFQKSVGRSHVMKAAFEALLNDDSPIEAVQEDGRFDARVSVRIPLELLSRIEIRAATQGVNRADLFRLALDRRREAPTDGKA